MGFQYIKVYLGISNTGIHYPVSHKPVSCVICQILNVLLFPLQLFRPREDKEDATKKNTEAPPQLVLACQQVVDTLVESVLRIEQVSDRHSMRLILR